MVSSHGTISLVDAQTWHHCKTRSFFITPFLSSLYFHLTTVILQHNSSYCHLSSWPSQSLGSSRSCSSSLTRSQSSTRNDSSRKVNPYLEQRLKHPVHSCLLMQRMLTVTSTFRCIVGWGRQAANPYEQESIKARIVNLITAVSTLMRSMAKGPMVFALCYIRNDLLTLFSLP